MDAIDLRIMDVLKENSRMTASEISKRVNLSVPAVAERIRKLEEARVIEKYTVKINREKTGYKLLAFVLVSIDKTENAEAFRRSVVQWSQVLECHHVAGEYDYLLKILAEDTKALEGFLTDMLKKTKGVLRSNTMISLSSLKENMNI